MRARLTLYEGFLLALRLQPQAARARLQAGLGEARACRDISVLIGHCVIARLEGSSGEFAKAFAELAEAERLMHIWDVPPIYYLAMITLVKCELWLAQGRTDLAEAWLARLGQTYNGEHAAAPPEFHPQLPLHIELQQALLEVIQGQPMLAEGRLNALLEHGQQTGRQLLSVMALTQKVTLLLGGRARTRGPQGAELRRWKRRPVACCNRLTGCWPNIRTGCVGNFNSVRRRPFHRALQKNFRQWQPVPQWSHPPRRNNSVRGKWPSCD